MFYQLVNIFFELVMKNIDKCLIQLRETSWTKSPE